MAAAASTKQLLRQLKDKDPERRKSAIKALARAKSRDALKTLARMSGDDRDAGVRELALKAGQYILHETGGLHVGEGKGDLDAPPPVELDKKGKIKRVSVDEESVKRAEKMMTDAMNAQQANDVARSMRLLAKALHVNPNLRTDSFFASLAEGATGGEGDEAIAMLYSREAQDEATHARTEANRREHDAAHQEKVSRFGLRDVGLDLAMLAAAAVVILVAVGFLAVSAAQAYISRVTADNADIINGGQLVTDEESQFEGKFLVIRFDEETGLPEEEPTFLSWTDTSTDFYLTTESVAEMGFASVLGMGVIAGLGLAVMSLIMTGIIHMLSSFLLGGTGTITYTAHAVLGLLVNRVVLLGIIAGLGAYMMFSNGSDSLSLALMIVSGIVVAQMLLKMAGRLTDAYDYGMPQGFVALLVGLVAFTPAVIVGSAFM